MKTGERNGMKSNPDDVWKESSVKEGSSLKSVANFLFEAGMLKKTPRTGFQFLGSGRESVAEHSFRTALLGYTLAQLAGHPQPCKVACLCLFHDMPEARTGDLNYVNKRYVSADEEKAVDHQARGLPFGDEYRGMIGEYNEAETDAAKLAHDADQIELILELKEQLDLGNPYASKWLKFAMKRVHTGVGRRLAEAVLETDHTAWWFEGHDHWWTRNQDEG
jgi:putative hydrolase of HD superfamily